MKAWERERRLLERLQEQGSIDGGLRIDGGIRRNDAARF